ncbi:P-loop containing nucleoside triphosphate hydrolase protein [Melanogaster broomeanus]|nr:P-loop containing nucleoside triphosphate hydrolase protein [Melanogaster broomeanus]
MADASNEKAPDQKQKGGFFSRKKKSSTEQQPDDVAVDTKPVVEAIPPVAFTQLFRYSTRFELIIDALGLVAAAGAGAAQPLMSLLFGNLTEDFVVFGNAESTYYQDLQSGNASEIAAAQQVLDAAAAGFRHNAALDATYLVCIGIGMFVCTYAYMTIWVYTGEVNSKRIREKYLEAILRQDIAYFDNVGAEIAEKASEDEVPLGRKNTNHSIGSDLAQKKSQEMKDSAVNGDDYGMFHLFVRVGSLNREELWRYVLGSMLAIVTGMVYPVFGIVYGHAIAGFSATTASARRTEGNENALWFFIIAILSSIAIGFQNYFFASSAAILTSKLRSLGFKSILKQDIEFFDKDENSTGALTANLSDNPQKINGLAGVTLGTIVQAIATLIGGSAIGLAYAYKPALVGMACIPFLMSTGYIRLRVVIMKDQQNKSAHENSAQLACEAVASMRTVASLTREEACLYMYSTSLDEPLRISNKTAVWTNMIYALSQSLTFFVIALVFWYGSTLVASLEITITAFFVALMSTTFGAMQAGNIFSFVPDISSARGKTLSGKNVEGQVQLENVHFRYPTRPGVRVLRDLSIKVEPGTYVALDLDLMESSLSIQLIERFYDPLAGQVLLDGQPINELNIQEYRKHISLVSQEPTLYAGTIRFNILLGATKPESEVTQEDIEAACRNANILEFIQSLPNGFDTQVGGKGSQLSGGQKQRIAIARALIRNPKVLLLDEATSALDSNSEKVVQEALDQAAKGRTTIAIAHRLSTIQNADCIYFLKEGRVSEAGTHDELLSLHGDYYEYVQLQALNK